MENKRLEQLLKEIDELKKRWDISLPLSEDEARMMKEDLEVTQTYNSNAIEGNILTLAETKAILLDGVTIAGKPLKDHLEAINHVYAMRYIDNITFNSDKKIKESEILEIHRLILNDIRTEDAGRYRKVRIYVSGSRRKFPEPEEVKGLMDKFIADMNSEAGSGMHPVIQAAHIHQGLVYIHPFIDGNGRTARLLMNLTLLRNGYPSATVFYTDRPFYYAALEKASFGDLKDFEVLIADAVKNSLTDYLSFVKIKSQALKQEDAFTQDLNNRLNKGKGGPKR
ncbi:MAG: Fic family protein [bacterium]